MNRNKLIQSLKELETIRLDGLRIRLIDAKGMVVGPLAGEIARILQGKDKPTYNPSHNQGDVVIVVNAAHVHFNKDQWSKKLYMWHTGYPGGVRERVASEQWDKDPTSILRKAVHGMLPRNRLRIYRMDKLKIFPQAEHPYTMFPDIVPYIPAARTRHLPELGWPLPPGLEPLNKQKYAYRQLVSAPVARKDRSDSAALPGASGRAGAVARPKKTAARKSSAASGLANIVELLTAEERRALEQESPQLFVSRPAAETPAQIEASTAGPAQAQSVDTASAQGAKPSKGRGSGKGAQKPQSEQPATGDAPSG